MQNENRPNIAEISGKLAADNARVNNFVDELMQHIDSLVAATTKSDWEEVRRLSDNIARDSAMNGFPIVSESAKKVNQAMEDPQGNEIDKRRSVIKLIGACGRARRPIK